MKAVFGGVLVVGVLAGCAGPQSLVSGGPSASLTIDLRSGSEGTNVQAWRVYSFNDASCASDEEGTLAARRIANSGATLDPIAAPAEKPLTLGFWYNEARFAQNRECSYTVTFTPKANESYKVRFDVAAYANACRVNVNDGNDQSIEVATPVMSCAKTLLGKIENGRPGILNTKVKVEIIPSFPKR